MNEYIKTHLSAGILLLRLFFVDHGEIFINRMKIAVAALAVILQEDPFHDIGNLCFNRLEQYDQILHGTVAGTDIHAADFSQMACSMHFRACSMASMLGKVSMTVSMVTMTR